MRRPRLLAHLCRTLATLAVAGPCTSARAQYAVDSARLHRDAVRAQAAFETTRRANLPVEASAGSGTGETRIGRYNYWHGDGAPDEPRAEPERIVAAGRRLLETLDAAARALPGDGWIAGQRVRYLVEAADSAGAWRAARECAARAPGWCAGLAGLAAHAAGAETRADSAFAVALAELPPRERCRWLDVVPFLDEAGRSRVEREERASASGGRGAACDDDRRRDERVAVSERLWWLAQPLWLTGANDLRAEHLARRVMARIQRDARSTHDTSWGWDVEELLLRYGWPTWWTRAPAPPMSGATASVTGHEPSPSWWFLPDARLASDTALARDDDWSIGARTPPARYAPSYARHFAPLDAQLALFRRGDSALVVAAWDAAADSALGTATRTEAALALGRSEREPVRVTRVTRVAPSPLVGTVTATARWGPLVASVELLSRDARAAARHRVGLRPPASVGGVALSDLLLYRPDDAPPRTLEAALPRALARARLRRDEPLGILWETYGLAAAGTTVSVTLDVIPRVPGLARRAAERLGLATSLSPLSVQWREQPDAASGIALRAISASLARLAPGRYLVRLVVTPAGGAPATSERELELVDR